jgi:hypothetical protein
MVNMLEHHPFSFHCTCPWSDVENTSADYNSDFKLCLTCVSLSQIHSIPALQGNFRVFFDVFNILTGLGKVFQARNKVFPREFGIHTPPQLTRTSECRIPPDWSLHLRILLLHDIYMSLIYHII